MKGGGGENEWRGGRGEREGREGEQINIINQVETHFELYARTLSLDGETVIKFRRMDKFKKRVWVKVKDNFFTGMFKKPIKNTEAKSIDEDSLEDKPLSESLENLSEGSKTKEKAGGFAGMFKKSLKLAPRSVTDEDPLSDAQFEYGSCDSLPDLIPESEAVLEENVSASNEDLLTKEKKSGFAGLFKRTPKIVEPQDGEDEPPANGLGIKRRRTIMKKKRVVSFRIKKTLPRLPKLGGNKMAAIDESLEMQELNSDQEGDVEVEQLEVEQVEVEQLEMAAYPTEENPVEAQKENDELMEWWKSVVGWVEWNETSNEQENEEEVMEEAADRVYMAALLFVRLFNQRGASLQHKILELLALADATDEFHKKTVKAAVGGGVASVAGSIATITGLILAPFTFGASIIVTAVGIGVATAGSITSATANITDTVHAGMDRKKMEKMIQSYQEEIKDISECLEFVQEGIDTLQEWDFEKYSESAAKKAMNHNIKHVVKEGGRAGKALMINTDKLISAVHVLGAAGGAAKALKAMSATTGVMSALFLALDVFFLARDSHELRKGAKTKFAAKIREVCKDLQDGLLELNKVKTQLQKTMDGIEVEEYEEIQEVEEEVEDDLESDPVKLAELEQELDLIEEKLDQRVEEERKRKEEEERKKKIEEEERKKMEEAIAAKEKLIEEAENEAGEIKKFAEEKSEGIYSVKESLKEFFKDPISKVAKKDLENKITADKEKGEKEKSIFGKKMHKKAVSLSEKEFLKELENGKNIKQEDKRKAKSHKVGQTTKQDAKTDENTSSDSKTLQDVAKVEEEKPKQEAEVDDSAKTEEKSHFKSLREAFMPKKENVHEKNYSKSVKEVSKIETNVDERVRSLRESWLAKEHMTAEKLASSMGSDKNEPNVVTSKDSHKAQWQLEEKTDVGSPILEVTEVKMRSKKRHCKDIIMWRQKIIQGKRLKKRKEATILKEKMRLREEVGGAIERVGGVVQMRGGVIMKVRGAIEIRKRRERKGKVGGVIKKRMQMWKRGVATERVGGVIEIMISMRKVGVAKERVGGVIEIMISMRKVGVARERVGGVIEKIMLIWKE
ncbi:hypothetical protein WMY93_000719 [Mugilogobius chulae]|uniref:Uncharacterized protein n=1 Tax=Mugilogobius chulae TaxID=88201 RepID=A0AAW0Q033_9GOBI